MKYALLGSLLTIIILLLIKQRAKKASTNGASFNKLLKTPEFQKLLLSKPFRDVTKTKEFKKLAFDYGTNYVITALGL